MSSEPQQALRVYLLCSRRPVTSEFVLLAERLRRRNYEPVLIVPSQDFVSLIGAGSSEKFETVCLSDRRTLSAWGWATGYAVLRRAGALLKRGGARYLSDRLLTWEGLARGERAARDIIGDRGSAAVLTGDDRSLRIDAGFLLHARRRGLLSISVAFAKSDPNADAGRREGDRAFLAANLPDHLAKHEPNLFRDVNGRSVSFLTAGEHAALAQAGAMFPAPWSYGGGLADKATYLCETDRAAAIALGVSRDKAVVTGQASYDVLHDQKARAGEIRQQLVIAHRLDPAKPLIVCSLPALGEHNMTTADAQMADAAFLLGTLSQANANVVVSLHPRQKKSDYTALAERFGVALADAPLRDILAAADLFVAYSSTLTWAVLLDIPSVALEYYDLDYRLFDVAQGMSVVVERDALSAAIARALEDDAYRAEMAERRRVARADTLFDGHSCDRIIDIIAGAQHQS